VTAPGGIAPGPASGSASGTDPFDDVIGQAEAVEQLRAAAGRPVHAYLLVGPPGAGKRRAALALAGELLAETARRAGDTDGVGRHRRLARAEAHPDLTVVEREGPFITREQARGIVAQSVRSPAEAACQVLLLTEFHLVVDAAPVLLKAIEEPPPSTVFLILADEITPELITIASRCVVIRFRALDPAIVAAELVDEGVDATVADAAARAAGGDLRRARILAADPGLGPRAALWASVPARLDGTGATVATLVAALLAALDEAFAPIDDRHRAELAELAEREERFGLRSTAKALEERQRRERRRFRSGELRFGLAVLARTYRERLADQVRAGSVGAGSVGVFDALQVASESIERNGNERLLLERLLLRLHPPT
jgi:DNA polymerase-3 subunit delta'